jgi:hypothetical protein
MFKDHLIFSNNIYDAAKQILEASVLDPDKLYTSSFKPGMSREDVGRARERGQKRANVLGQMLAAQTYNAVNADEQDAFARIRADTQAPYGTGIQASSEHLRTALGAVKRLKADPKFAEHLTQTIAPEITDVAVGRAMDAGWEADAPLNAKERAALQKVSTQHAENLPASATPSDVTAAYGQRMFNTFPADKATIHSTEYSHAFPRDIVTKMLKKK